MSVEADVLKFMTLQSRPFALPDIIRGVGNGHERSAVQRATEKLASKGTLLEKVYNKQRIYCICDKPGSNSNLNSELQKIEQEINQRSTDLKEVDAKLKIGLDRLKEYEGQMTLEEAKCKQEELEKEVAELQEQSEKLKGKLKVVSAEEKQKAKTTYEAYVKEYRKRKRMCMEIVNCILENYPKTKEKLLEEMSVETDEDVGFFLLE